MRDKFVYSCSIKICASGFNKLFPRVLLVKHWDAWRSGCQLMKGQVSMVDTTKLLSPIHSSFAAWVVQYAVRHCRGEELGPFCWPIPAVGVGVFVHLVCLMSILLRCNGFTEIQKTVVDHAGSRPPNSDHDLFGCKFGSGKCFGASFWSSHWAGRCQLSYKVHIKIWLKNGSLLSHRIREADTSKQKFFWVLITSWGIHWSILLSFLICFKCQKMVEWSTLSSLATSHVDVWRRQWHPTPVLLPGKSHGWRSLAGCSPWGR